MSAKQEVILSGESGSIAPAHNFSFAEMQRMAVAIAKANIFGVKDADQALSLMMIAQAEGKHPALIARDFDLIQGRPAKKSEAILRDFLASGGKVEWHELSDSTAKATFHHQAAVRPLTIDWTIARAKAAGLMDKNGGMYQKYPRQMLRARCISEGCRTLAPSSTSGFYTPEEVQQIDEAPEPIGITAAVEQAAVAPTAEEVEAAINSMDVPSLPALEASFAAAWRSTKDKGARDKYKATYDAMRVEIQEAMQRDVQDEK